MIHIETLGRGGPDLVFLHGWAMHSGIWDGIKDQLAQQYRVHLVDLPGHGRSTPCASDVLDQWVTQIANQLPTEAIVCGWSLGGLIAMQLARQKLLQVKQLVLVATTPCFIKQTDWQWGMDAGILKMFSTNLLQNYESTIHRFLSLQVSGEAHATTILKQLRQHFTERNRPEIATLQDGLTLLLTSDLRANIKEITQPVLLLHGERDVITHPEAARWTHQQLVNSQLAILPECGHAPFLSYPEQFINHLNEFRASTR